KTKDNTILFSVKIKDNKEVFLEYNYKYIIEILLPRILELKNELDEYTEKTGGTTPNSVPLYAEYKECKQLCKEQNIDYKRFEQLDRMFLGHFWRNYPDPDYGTDEIGEILKKWGNFKFLYDSEFITLLSKLSTSDCTLFAENLWTRIIKKYPEVLNRYTFLSFKNYLDENNIGEWLNSFILSGEKSFTSFFKKNLKNGVSYISHHPYDTGFKIGDFGNEYSQKFYSPLELASSSIFGKGSHYLIEKQEPLTEKEQSVITCHHIINDAIKLDREIIGKQPKFTIEKIFGLAKIFLLNITYKSIEWNYTKVYFVNSIRATSQRFYSFASHDSEFHSFIVEFLRRTYSEEEKNFITKWLKEFEIAENVKMKLFEGAGSQVILNKDGENINLVDLGYGVTQFLPIVLKIAYCKNIGKQIIAIEEPETNLHPKFQSKLADMFADAHKSLGIRFIIETHSEYLIRKLQYLTAKGVLKTDKTVIHYIGHLDKNKRTEDEEQVRTIYIKPNGQLTKPFGGGFYDEADNLALALLDCSLN
ncbi:MAG: AAA family ATPase, partial [Bacteroidales bacterium]|nr:AAA family ATPase [Bacteroidales bacterium]